MQFLLSINRKFYNNFDYDWIYHFLSYDVYNKINGCEIFVNLKDNEEQKYVLSLLENNLIKNWQIQFHAPDLIDYFSYKKNYLNLIEYYHRASQKLGYKVKVTFHPVSSTYSKKDSILKTKQELYKICNLVQKHNLDINILIENLNKMPNLYRCNLNDLNEILDIDNINLTWDIGHLIVDNIYNFNLNDKYLSKLKNIHIHDTFKNEHFPFYNNKTDLEKCSEYLNKINYNGTIVAEMALDYMKSNSFNKKILEYAKNMYILAYYFESLISNEYMI